MTTSPTPRTTRSVAVIGGGIAGPVTAAALARTGLDVSVFEAYPPTDDGIGSALALAPNGLRALEVIRAADAVRTLGLPITSSSMTVRGHDVGTMPALSDLPPQHMVQRSDLHRILREAALEAGVRFHHDRRLVDVDEYEDRVTAHFADGSTADADVLVGADGVRSTVRRLVDPGAPTADYTGLLSFSATVQADLDRPPGAMTFAFGRRAYYLYWVNADGTVTWGVNLPSPQYLSLTDARQVPLAEWVDRIRATYDADSPGGLLARATTTENLEVQGAIHIMPPVPHWYRGRMVLVGDAVHCPSNSTGQGASLAIESAIELARCLRDRPDPTSAFEAYVGLRRDRVEAITRRGARLNGSKAPGTVAQHLMRLAMPVLFRRMDPEKTFGAEQRFTIDWDSRVG